ncbi:DUF3108 domain-containing protein [Cereibacter azotoformans]|uniref:Uncharacterized protein DUF3108 n=1 Tax=Cereibacter azotoformans TaxID=43057 RepID=A0A2T5JYQ5_9RHOB|nr:DUF3108 domain-containing protein [Cereibacter azotoformans]AXQ94483.1 DUF3108 domain-containing protein [Cereibacter sphaeroides]MBO4170683.1 DUF3108 domain-containing protein [Cereibacter azotoformans]PTR15313.1 uncharacterized protein DUF3108 [Cereibacter azotoformans]UIJ30030.1 DUF3108 domain-containing protein [Cereibacter azotoformans]
MRTALGMAALALLLAAPAAARTDEAAFDLVLRGVRAGTFSFSGAEEAGRYSVNGRLQSAGLLGLVRRMRYDAQASGRMVQGRPEALSYSEKADTGRRQSEVVLAWDRGRPRVERYAPARKPRPYDVDPAAQRGTVDPMTALYAALRDVEPGQECRLSLDIFDGRRRTQVVLGTPKAIEGGVSCAGEFRRVAGYSPEDMAEKPRFPFTLYYQPTADGRMRVMQVATDTIYGKATLRRR